MSATEQLVLSWFLNAVWEVPASFFCCWVFLRFVPDLSARLRHLLWLAALGLGFISPMGTLLGLWGEFESSRGNQPFALPVGLSSSSGVHLLVLMFLLPALWRAFLLLHGGIAANRLQRLAVPVDLSVIEDALPKALLVKMHQYHAGIFTTGPESVQLGPFTSGMRRPFILIPSALLVPSKGKTLVSVVAHELAHVQRRDIFWHLVCEVLLMPLAFHPFSYLFRSRLAEAREMACDAVVTEEALPATDYARGLLDVAGIQRDSASPLHALGISESAALERRIHALISLSSLQDRILNPWQKCCLILAASTLLVLLFSAGRTIFLWMSAVPRPSTEMFQSPPPPPPPPPNRR